MSRSEEVPDEKVCVTCGFENDEGPVDGCAECCDRANDRIDGKFCRCDYCRPEEEDLEWLKGL